MEFGKRVVPPERLFFFEFKEGRGPLCEILGVPVPDELFRRGKDAKAVDELSRKVSGSVVLKWVQILGAGVAVVGVGLYYLL